MSVLKLKRKADLNASEFKGYSYVMYYCNMYFLLGKYIKRYIKVEHFNPWFQKEYNNSDKNYSLQGYNKNNLLYIQRLDF